MKNNFKTFIFSFVFWQIANATTAQTVSIGEDRGHFSPQYVNDTFYRGSKVNSTIVKFPSISKQFNKNEQRWFFDLTDKLIDRKNRFDLATVNVIEHEAPMVIANPKSYARGYSTRSVYFASNNIQVHAYIDFYKGEGYFANLFSRISIEKGGCIPLKNFVDHFSLKRGFIQTWNDAILVSYENHLGDLLRVDVLNTKSPTIPAPKIITEPLKSCVTGIEFIPSLNSIPSKK